MLKKIYKINRKLNLNYILNSFTVVFLIILHIFHLIKFDYWQYFVDSAKSIIILFVIICLSLFEVIYTRVFKRRLIIFKCCDNFIKVPSILTISFFVAFCLYYMITDHQTILGTYKSTIVYCVYSLIYIFLPFYFLYVLNIINEVSQEYMFMMRRRMISLNVITIKEFIER